MLHIGVTAIFARLCKFISGCRGKITTGNVWSAARLQGEVWSRRQVCANVFGLCAITFDAEMGRRIDSGPGRSAFVQYFIANKPTPIRLSHGRILSSNRSITRCGMATW